MEITYGPIKVEKWKPELAGASAYLRGEHIILAGTCITNIGGFACDPFLSMKSSISDAELGAALLRVLADSKSAPVPSDLKASGKKLLKTANVRSWSKLSEGVCCSIEQKAKEISIVPSKREGRAFMHMPESTVRVSIDESPDQIGRALREGFDKCL